MSFRPDEFVNDRAHRAFFSKVKGLLEKGYDWQEIHRRCTEFFKTDRKPSDRELHEWVNWMVQAKLAPSWFVQFVVERRRAERAVDKETELEELAELQAWEEQVRATATVATDAEPEPPSVASIVASSISFDGDALDVVELEGAGWVSLPSLLAPFGKRADHAAGLLEGWARTRIEFVAPRQEGSNDYRVKRTTLLHVEDAPLLVARLDQRGMNEATKAKHARYLRHVARVLADHFGLRPAPAPPQPTIDPVLARLLDGQNQIAGALAGKLGNVEARVEEFHARVDEAGALAKAAKQDAEDLRAVTEAHDDQLRLLHSRTAHRTRNEPPPPPPGWIAEEDFATSEGLPSVQVGARVVHSICRALGIIGNPELCLRSKINGRIMLALSPKCVDTYRSAFIAARHCMGASGYALRGRLMLAAHDYPPPRSVRYVVERMCRAAVRDVNPQMKLRPIDGGRASA